MSSKSDSRHESRKVAVQLLFNLLYSPNEGVSAFSTKELAEFNETKKINKEIIEHTSGVENNLDRINPIIQILAPERDIDQMSQTNLVILQLMIYEGFIAKTIPTKVAINEGIELAKDFGNESDAKFVNGVLGALINKPELINQLNG